MNPEDKSKINELNKSLYSRNAPDIRTKRRLRYKDGVSDVRTDWDHIPESGEKASLLNEEYKDSSMSFLTKILISSIIFFILALGIGAYLVLNGGNVVSADNVDININGPVSIAAGEPATFDIQVVNNNSITLKTVDLSIDYPAGTTDALDSKKDLTKSRELIPDIVPGGVGQKTIKAILYGQENTSKQIKTAIEYRIDGSNAVFLKEKVFDVLIASSPLTLTASSFKEVNPDQEFDLSVSIVSNSKETIKDLVLKAVYPFGFKYISSDIKTASDNTLWKIGDIPPGSKRIIKIRGKLDAQNDEVRVFRFAVGSAKKGNENIIGTEYVTTSQEISISKPFMTVGLSVNGESNSKQFASQFNNPIKVDIGYFNNLQTPIIDGEIRVKLSGSAFDKVQVSVQDGLYQSINNEIVWNSVTSRELNTIDAGGNGRVSFSVTPRDLSSSMNLITNPDLKFIVSVKGKRNSEANVPERISTTAEAQVRINSNLAIGGQILRSYASMQNTGPIPPKVEQATTYTVLWTVDNTVNTLNNVLVQSSLPPNIKWVGKVFPETEDIGYDPVTGSVQWNVGSLQTYTAGTNKRRQVAFQISLTPAINQVGSILNLVNATTLTAVDDFTGQTLKSNLGVLTTRFSTDPTFKEGDEKVSQ
jgi:hypothetical protein